MYVVINLSYIYFSVNYFVLTRSEIEARVQLAM